MATSYVNQAYQTLPYPSSSSEQRLDESVTTTTRTEVFIKENGIALKQQDLNKGEIIESIIKLLEWVHGPGFKLLESQRDLPVDFEQAQEIRKSHEQFEFKCMQALATYAKLRDIRADDNEINDYLERLESTIQDFLRQLQYRRQVVLSFFTFFRLHRELLQHLQDIHLMVQKQDFIRVEETEQYLNDLEKALRYAETLFQQLLNECDKIKSIVSVQEIIVIITTLVTEVRTLLGKEFEVLKIRILETKKLLQLLNYDKDARQSVIWLEDLIRILLESYLKYNVGKTPIETSELIQQYHNFETKSQETYIYGKDLLSNLIQMYQKQGRSIETCNTLLNNAENHWIKLKHLLSEVKERYEIADTFHKNVDNILERIEKLIWLISRDLDAGKSIEQVRKIYANDRHEVITDYEGTKKIGVTLMERIKYPLANEKDSINPIVIDEVEDVIKMKLFTLWLKIRELYYYLGQNVEIDEVTERWEMVRITIDKLYERMSYWFGRWNEGKLPCTIPDAEYLLEEHDKAKRDISKLWKQVDMDLEQIIKTSENEDISDLAIKAQEDAEIRCNEWMHRWQAHKEKLDNRYRLLLALRELEVQVEDISQQLVRLKSQPVEDLEVVRKTNNGVIQLSDNVTPIESRKAKLFKEVKEYVGNDFNMHLDKIDKSWKDFIRDLELFQMFIEMIVRMLEFIVLLYQFVDELKRGLPQCRSREEAEPWFQKIQAYNKKSTSFDCDWLLNVAQRLYGNNNKPKPVIEKLKKILANLSFYESEISEMVTIESITLVHSKVNELKFFKELNDESIQSGRSCRLQVEYSTPNPKTTEVEWLRNRRPIPTKEVGGKWIADNEDGFSTLSCNNIAVEDAGNFVCKVRCNGDTIETFCTVKVLSPPHFDQTLEDTVQVNQDEQVLLQCHVKGHPTPNIEWSKNGTSLRRNYAYDIDNRDGVCALKISRVSGDNSGMYTCKATNDAGEATTVTHLKVHEFKRCHFIRKLPDDIDLFVNERLRLRVEFEGDPTPEVTWYKGSSVLRDETPRTSIVTTKDFSICTIDPVFETDSGLYSVVVKNRAGQEKCVCSASIRLRGRGPHFLTPLLDDSVTEGSVVRLNCVVEGEPMPKVSWYKNGKPFSKAGRFDVRFNSDQRDGKHEVEISETRLEDEGEYSIVAENSEGRVESKCFLSVDPMSDESPSPMAPRFSGNINEQLVAHVTDKVTLQCTVHGYPMPTIAWYKDGIRIYTDDHIIISGFEESHSLVIPFVRREDEGVYKITASNPVGSADCKCTLRVIDDDEWDAKRTTLVFHNTVVRSPPEFVRLFRDEFCKVGDGVALECEIEGIPDPTVWWSFNGEPISDNSRQFRLTSSDNCHTLLINHVTMAETGRYSITAENSSGVATCSALLIVEEPGHTGSYEQWARNSYRASNSRPITPIINLRPLTPISHFTSRQTEQMQSVDVSPRFDIATKLSVGQSPGPISPQSPVYRVETHDVDYKVTNRNSHLSPALPKFSTDRTDNDSIHKPKVNTGVTDIQRTTVRTVRTQPYEAVEKDIDHEVRMVRTSKEETSSKTGRATLSMSQDELNDIFSTKTTTTKDELDDIFSMKTTKVTKTSDNITSSSTVYKSNTENTSSTVYKSNTDKNVYYKSQFDSLLNFGSTSSGSVD